MEAAFGKQDFLERSVRNSGISVAKEKRSFLTYKANCLVNCSLEETEDSVNFIFDIRGLQESESIFKMSEIDQLRFLVNCALLYELDTQYDFSLSLENILLDINLMPQLLIRDAKKSETPSFIRKYKALIGSVLLHKYKYDDYLLGGEGLYKKDKYLQELATMKTTEEIRQDLLEKYQHKLNETNQSKCLVSKKRIWFSRITIPMLAVALIATSALGLRMTFLDIPFRDSVIDAGISYIRGDFLGVQVALNNYGSYALPDDVKHFLSRSYVSTEALTNIQRENILLGLTPMTAPLIFDYWITVGRLQFDEAVDIAQRLGDDELLLFAYLKQEVFVRQDTSMPGEERAALLDNLERNIDELNNARSQATSSLLGLD